MKLTREQVNILQEELTAELIEILMEEWGYSMQEAFNVLYNSDTFAILQDPDSGLYYQSSGYVYSFLEEELRKGKIA